MIKNLEFDFHLDASHYGFKFSQAQYIHVWYLTWKDDKGKIQVSVIDWKASPTVLSELKNIKEVVRLVEAASKNNANNYWEEQEGHVFANNNFNVPHLPKRSFHESDIINGPTGHGDICFSDADPGL